jgi:3-hydroxyacyl-[acyl-carrier-protein] dehydratase
MLQGNFYDIINSNSSTDAFNALLSLNKDHDILKGHFPGQPVVPGVCMMQIVRELVEYDLKRNLRLAGADNMKFLSILDPNQTAEVTANILYKEEDGVISVNASLFSGAVTFFKLKATLVPVK